MADSQHFQSVTRTGRIYIRPVEVDDTEQRVRWLNDPELQQYLSFDWPVGVEATRQWVRRVSTDASRRDFTVFLADTCQPIGWVGLIGIDQQIRKAEIYFGIGEESARGIGLAHELCQLIATYGFDELGLNRLVITHHPDNAAMERIVSSNGWTLEGRLRQDRWHHGLTIDRIVWGLLRGEGSDDTG